MRNLKKLLLYIVTILLFLFGCQSKNDAVYREIDLNLFLKESQDWTCCYQNEDIMILSVGSRNGNMIGPLENTENLLVYDYHEEKVLHKYEISGECYVMSAMPYEEGILYVYYSGFFDDVPWQVIYASAKGNTVLDEGNAISYDRTPYLFELDGNPAYLWESGYGAADYQYGVNQIIDNQSAALCVSQDGYLCELRAYSNGEAFFFPVDNGNELAVLQIGDQNGINCEYTVSGKIVSMDITQEYIVCSLAEENGKSFWLSLIPLIEGEERSIPLDNPLYRISGGKGETCLCVNWNFDPFEIDLKTGNIEGLDIPENASGLGGSIGFYPCGKRQYLVRFYRNKEILLYMLKL